MFQPVQQGKKIILFKKYEGKSYLLTDDMIAYVINAKKYIKKLLANKEDDCLGLQDARSMQKRQLNFCILTIRNHKIRE